MKKRKKITVLNFTTMLLRKVIPYSYENHDFIIDLIDNLKLAVLEKGHNGLSLLQMQCVFSKYFKEDPKEELGKKVKKLFQSFEFIDDKGFIGYKD